MRKYKRFYPFLRIFLLLGMLVLSSAFAASASYDGDGTSSKAPLAGQAPKDGIQRLSDDTNGSAQVSLNKATGTASFVRLKPGSLPYNIDSPPGKSVDKTANSQALSFLQAYGDAFGIRDLKQELQLIAVQKDHIGTLRVNYQQVYQGVPVFAGALRVHFNAKGQLTAANGTFIPDIDLETTPSLSAADAEAIALAEVVRQQGAKNKITPAGLMADNATLYVFRANLARGIPGGNYLVYEVEVGNGIDIREFVYVNAHTGKIIDQISGINEAIDRRIYNGGFGSSYLVWQEGAVLPYTGADSVGINRLIDYAEDTYNLFSSMTNGAFLSWDGSDGIMHSVYNDPAISCPNANWNGTSTNYCTGVDADDTVGHEWAHAYTESTHNLIYQWQSGALNESYSDIWGEVVDFLNGDGLDSPGGPRSAGGCSVFGSGSNDDNSYRWLSGEDDTAFGGAIRDMWTPTCYGDPGKVSDTQYWCSTSDGGGVHTNSGIPNHAFALLVDGGTYNGQTITAIGLTKAAHIYWRAQNMYQMRMTDFSGHADALEQSCADFSTGPMPLYELSVSNPAGVVSGETVSAADCAEVGKAIAAVELRGAPTQCNFATVLDPNAPALCTAPESPISVLTTDWESGLAGWVVGTYDVTNPATFDTPDWAVVGALPGGRSGQGAFVKDDPTLGNCGSDDESGVLYLESPVITIPGGVTTPLLAFDHWVALETEWDGGNVKIKVNGGAWTLVPAGAFTFNAYNATLNTGGAGNTNPMANQPVFTGFNEGTVGSGNWGQSQVNLSGLAGAGDTIQLRFEMGLDGCNGIQGWYVDDVQTYYCSFDSDFTLAATPATQTVCAPNEARYDVTVGQIAGVNDPVTLSMSGHPAGTTLNYGPNPLTPPGSSAITITNTGAGTAGSYNIEITGVTATSTHTATVQLDLFSGAPGSTSLTLPANGATDISVGPMLQWNAVSQADSYTLEIATDSGFSTIVYSTIVSGASHSVATPLNYGALYYWRVTPQNVCGNGGASAEFSFTTRAKPLTTYLPFIEGRVSLLNGDFESGQTDWFEYSLNGYDLIYSAGNLPAPPYGGSWAAWLGGDDSEISYIQQQVVVPLGAPYLGYWHWIDSKDFCGWDFGKVVINGSAVVDVYDLCSLTGTSGWVKHVVDLSAYAGQSVSLQIRVETDSSLLSNLFVDDVSFQLSPTVLDTSSSAFVDLGETASKSGNIVPAKDVVKETSP